MYLLISFWQSVNVLRMWKECAHFTYVYVFIQGVLFLFFYGGDSIENARVPRSTALSSLRLALKKYNDDESQERN